MDTKTTAPKAETMTDAELEQWADAITSYIASFDENESALAKAHNKAMIMNLAKKFRG